MLTPIAIALILNSLTLTFALGLLILILWHDPRRLTNLYFAWFLVMVTVWSAGSLLSRTASIAGADLEFIEAGLRMLEIGFTGSSLAIYIYVIVLIGNRSRQFQLIAIASILALLVYQIGLLWLAATPTYSVTVSGILRYSFSPVSTLLFTLINSATLVLVWQGFRKIQRSAMAFGIMLFALGQLSALLSPRLQALGIAEDAGSLATLIMAFALVQAQIIQPLAGQSRQIEVVRDVGLAITSRLRLQNVLETIAAQAATLLRADASIIFLRREGDAQLILAAQHNIHKNVLGYRLPLDQGVAGKVAGERRPTLIIDYRREWRGIADAPFANEGFGSVIAVPLIFADAVVGVLLVIQGVESRLFEPEDVRLLELLAPQAAVAITNSRLFEQERALTDKLESAKTQLEAFLSSTDNPVIALNKDLRIIFANKAASSLVAANSPDLSDQRILDLIPQSYLPRQLRKMAQDFKRSRSHVYELDMGEHTYLCHVARISHPERAWVVVLNEVTSLKELDRLQRQMVELTTHQLKNPLQAALLHLDELSDLGDEITPEEMAYGLEVIEEQMIRMQLIIGGILNLERLYSRPSARNEQVDLGQVVRDVIQVLRQHADSRQIQIHLLYPEDIPYVVGDTNELTEVISNLVDNAIKYSLEFGAIKVEGCYQDGQIQLKVSDNGIGIPQYAQSKVFDRFYRVEQPGTEQISGTGIGLSLVKAIVESHKGRIWLESEPGRGTTFYIALPPVQ
jgi:two-component system phosphate regulon sensor histidine kinase PhoR